jgi:hypothetical protein
MNRRQHTLTAWLLPLLCLRALLPTGFMPVVSEAGWQIVVCSGSAYQPSSQLPSKAVAITKNVASDSNHSNQKRQTGDGPCVFALSATSAPIPFISAADFAQSLTHSYLQTADEWLLSRPLIRAQQSRAPPFFS